MKHIISILLLVLVSNIYAQKAETVHQLAIKGESFDFYKTQAEAWKKIIDKDKSNEDAWYNYYKACRYGRMMFFRAFPKEPYENWTTKSKAFKEESDIIKLINENIPKSFTAELLNYNEALFSKQVKNDRTKHLFNAYKINPNHPEIQDEMASHYEIRQDLAKRKEQNKHWYSLNSMSSAYLNYAYNTLMSVDDNAIIFTGGDNDTYALWMIQDVLEVAPNATIINSSLICKPDYREKVFSKLGINNDVKNYNPKEGSIFPNQIAVFKHVIEQISEERPVYVALTAHKQLYADMEDDFYLTGLAKQYSKTNIDEIAVIKRNFHKRFLIDYLKENFVYDIAQDNLNRIAINYTPALLKLYMHYELSEEQDAMAEIKSLMKQISSKASPEMLEWYKSTFEK
jgi:hypothetical protein